MNAPRITDEAVEAAYDLLDEHGHNGLDCRPRTGFDLSVRAALEAALPHLEGSTCGHQLVPHEDSMRCVVAAGVEHSRHIDAQGGYWGEYTGPDPVDGAS